MPVGRTWGSTGGVAVDRYDNVWVAERCGANSCAGSDLAPILEFDSSGKPLKSFGAGMFVFPHGVTVDQSDNVWVTDGLGKDGKGQQIFKFSPDGKVLGEKGTAPGDFDVTHCVTFDFQRTFVCLRQEQQPHPNLRPGRQLHQRIETV